MDQQSFNISPVRRVRISHFNALGDLVGNPSYDHRDISVVANEERAFMEGNRCKKAGVHLSHVEWVDASPTMDDAGNLTGKYSTVDERHDIPGGFRAFYRPGFAERAGHYDLRRLPKQKQ